jgi:putative transposase
VLAEFPFYGYPRVTKELHRRGWQANEKRIHRLMQQYGFCQKRRKYKPRTTNSRHGLPWHPNRIRDIIPSFPNHIWAGDITYIRLANGTYCYLAGLIDVFTRKIRGWALMNTMSVELILAAWACARKSHPAPRFHHSDRGSQYCAEAYVAALQKDGAEVSMSEKGESTQNPYIESFWRSLKVEEVYLNEYETMADAQKNIGHFSEIVYAKKRLHSSLGYQTPEEFESAWPLTKGRIPVTNQITAVDRKAILLFPKRG